MRYASTCIAHFAMQVAYIVMPQAPAIIIQEKYAPVETVVE
jgi:hypothetical protein